jgi:hypothetical protein
MVFQARYEQVKELDNFRLSKVAQMFKEHWSGLITHLRHRLSNGWLKASMDVFNN